MRYKKSCISLNKKAPWYKMLALVTLKVAHPCYREYRKRHKHTYTAALSVFVGVCVCAYLTIFWSER